MHNIYHAKLTANLHVFPNVVISVKVFRSCWPSMDTYRVMLEDSREVSPSTFLLTSLVVDRCWFELDRSLSSGDTNMSPDDSILKSWKAELGLRISKEP